MEWPRYEEESPVSRGGGRLSNVEIERILDVESPIRTGFTYARSQAYNRRHSDWFVHPRMSRPMSGNSSFEEAEGPAKTTSLYRNGATEKRSGVFRCTIQTVWSQLIFILTSPFYVTQIVFATGISCLSSVARRCATFADELYHLLSYLVEKPFEAIRIRSFNGWLIGLMILLSAFCLPFIFLPGTVKSNEDQVMSLVAKKLAEQNAAFLKEIEKISEHRMPSLVESKLAEQKTALLSEIEKTNGEKVFSMITSKLTEQSAELMAEIEKFSEDRVLAMTASLLAEQKATFLNEIEQVGEEKLLSMVAKLKEQNAELLAEIEQIKEERHSVTDSCSGRQVALNEDDVDRIQKMITRSIDVYDADKTGKADYALESAGGSMIGTRCTEPYQEKSQLESFYGIPLWYSSNSPRSVIQRKAQGTTAGECWAFVGGQGYLTVRLAGRVDVSSVSYEHLPASVSPQGHIRSAPKEFLVWSYQDPDDMSSRVLLGSYEFDSEGSAIQTFDVQNVDPLFTPVIELEVVSNHGNDYTCLYRFRVHGKLVQQ